MGSPEKGSRKFQASHESALIIGLVSLATIAGAVLQPALAPVAPAFIGAVGIAVLGKDGAHAWGNAQEHKADGPSALAQTLQPGQPSQLGSGS